MKLGKFKMREALPKWKDFKLYSIMEIEFDEEGNPIPHKVTKRFFAWFWLKELKLLSHCWFH